MKKIIKVASTTQYTHDRHHVLLYGSLRKDCERHNLISEDESNKFIANVKLPNYTLYMHKGASYPYAAYSKDSYVLCELWNISEVTMRAVRKLEEAYVERNYPAQDYSEIVKYDIHSCSFFVQPLLKIQEWQRAENSALIEIGPDWVKHCKLTNNFCYKPNALRARRKLPSFQQIHEEKLAAKEALKSTPKTTKENENLTGFLSAFF